MVTKLHAVSINCYRDTFKNYTSHVINILHLLLAYVIHNVRITQKECFVNHPMSFVMQQFVYQSVEIDAHVYSQAYASVVLGGQELGVEVCIHSCQVNVSRVYLLSECMYTH